MYGYTRTFRLWDTSADLLVLSVQYYPILFFLLLPSPWLRLLTDTLMNGMINLMLPAVTPGIARVTESRWVDWHILFYTCVCNYNAAARLNILNN